MNSCEVGEIEHIPIQNLFQLADKTMINIIGICYDIGKLKNFTSAKSDVNMKKRQITLIDQTETPIIVNLWNAEASSFENCFVDTVVLIKNGQIFQKDGKK